jgi:transposase
VNRRFEITDDEWERLAPLLPSTKPRRGGRWRDHRQVLNGILFRVRSGVPWRDLPEQYGPWQTVCKRFARWQADGTWARVEACLRTQADAAGQLDWDAQVDSTVVRGPPGRRRGQERGITSIQASRQQALGRSRGGLTTKVHTICDGGGRNLATRLTPGQDGDTSQLVALVDQVRVARPGGRGRPRTRPDHLIGDKAYSSRANRAALRARHIRHTIPERDDQKANRVRRGGRGGRPPAFDRIRYRQRNRVERLMNRRKQFRAVATRYDKLAGRYQATITIADIFIWLRARSDQPRGDP